MRRYTAWMVPVLLLGLLCPPSVPADIDCDGVDDALTTGVALSSLITASSWTISAWIKVQGTAPTGTDSCWNGAVVTGDADGYVAVARFDDSTFCGYLYDGDTKIASAPSASGWSHLAVRAASGTLSLWHNGVQVASTSAWACRDTQRCCGSL